MRLVAPIVDEIGGASLEDVCTTVKRPQRIEVVQVQEILMAADCLLVLVVTVRVSSTISAISFFSWHAILYVTLSTV